MNRSTARVGRRAVHGVLLLDKPLGLSSNDALQKVKRLFRAEKAGHTGTLDPLATGLLPLCFGAATKFSQLHLDADKAYVATIRLGIRTTTGDAEGEIVSTRAVRVDDALLQDTLRRFTGAIRQVPPLYSALKHEGRPLYEYARAGAEIEREARAVTIHALELLHRDGDALKIAVRCSKGTYVRTLAEDLGEALGCGGHLAALCRTGTGAWTLEQAYPLERLQALNDAERDRLLLPVDALLHDCVAVQLAVDDAGRFLAGQRRRVDLQDAPLVRVYGPDKGAFLGSACVKAGELIPLRLLSPPEVQSLTSQTFHH